MRHPTVQDVMTHQVVTAHRDTPFKAVAALPARNDVSAVPVVDQQRRPVGIVSEAGVLAGIVSRGDLLRVFLRPDGAIRQEIVHQVFERTLFIAPSAVLV